jgi:hypothetical protein
MESFDPTPLTQHLPAQWLPLVNSAVMVLFIGGRVWKALQSGGGLIGIWRSLLYGGGHLEGDLKQLQKDTNHETEKR